MQTLSAWKHCLQQLCCWVFPWCGWGETTSPAADFEDAICEKRELLLQQRWAQGSSSPGELPVRPQGVTGRKKMAQVTAKNVCNLNFKSEKTHGFLHIFYGSKEPVFPQRVPLLWRVMCSFLHHPQPFRPYIYKHVSLAAAFQRGNRLQITEENRL